MKTIVPGLSAEQQAIYDKLNHVNQRLYVNNLQAGLTGRSVEVKDLREKSREAALMFAQMGAISAPMAMAVLSTGAFDIVPTVIPALASGPAIVAVGATAAAVVAKATEHASEALVHFQHNTRAALSALRRTAAAQLDGPSL